jgi:hypothetical protein
LTRADQVIGHSVSLESGSSAPFSRRCLIQSGPPWPFSRDVSASWSTVGGAARKFGRTLSIGVADLGVGHSRLCCSVGRETALFPQRQVSGVALREPLLDRHRPDHGLTLRPIDVRHGDAQHLGELAEVPPDEMGREGAVVDLRHELRRLEREATRERRLGELPEGEADVSSLAVVAPG